MRHHKKPIRIFSDLKNVITENCAKKQSDPTLEPNRLKNSTKIVPKKQSDPTLEPNGLKNSTKIVPKKQSDPILEPNGLKNSTNAASQKTYPNFFGLEKCHK